MAAETGLAKLLMDIEALRQRAAQARRLARAVAHHAASQSLNAFAAEIDSEIEKLEAQAAVMKQAAAETAQASEREQSIAAVKPPSGTGPEEAG